MNIYSNSEMVIEVPINFLCVDTDNAIDGGDGIMLPYENKDFLFSVKNLVDSNIMSASTSWKEPDYDKSKVYFYISRGKVNLAIEVLPRYYSAREKQILLSTVDDEEKENGRSNYIELINMFDDIDEILNCEYPIGEIEMYSIQLTPEENSKLFSFIE